MNYDWLWYPALCLAIGVLCGLALYFEPKPQDAPVPAVEPLDELDRARERQTDHLNAEIDMALRGVGWIAEQEGETK